VGEVCEYVSWGLGDQSLVFEMWDMPTEVKGTFIHISTV